MFNKTKNQQKSKLVAAYILFFFTKNIRNEKDKIFALREKSTYWHIKTCCTFKLKIYNYTQVYLVKICKNIGDPNCRFLSFFKSMMINII